jgi:hypothetical protein
MSQDWTLYVFLFVLAAMIMLRLDRLGKQIEAVHHSILLEVPLDEEARAELTRERTAPSRSFAGWSGRHFRSAVCHKRTHALHKFLSHSITSSARLSSVAGTSMPSCFAA